MRNSTGARNVVPITISRIAASRPGLSSPEAVPRPRKIRPTSPRGIIPSPTTRLLVFSLLKMAQPAATLPMIATTNRKAATTRAERAPGSEGLITERSIPAPTSTKKTVANKPTMGVTAA